MTTTITIMWRWVSGSADVSVPSYDQGSRTLVDSFYHCFLLSWWSPYFSRWWYLTLRMLKLQCVCCHLFWIQLFAQFDQMVDQIYHLEAGDTLEVVAALPEGCAARHILILTIPTSNSISQSCNHTINPSSNCLSHEKVEQLRFLQSGLLHLTHCFRLKFSQNVLTLMLYRH